MNHWIKISISAMAVVACQSPPPAYSHVRIGADYPQGNCREIGQVIGNADHIGNAREESMRDMQMQAAGRQANYVRLIAVTARGTAARGIAYQCR